MTRDDHDNQHGKRSFVKREPKRDDNGRKNTRKGRAGAFERPEDNEGERIAKRLARAGIASRREAESMIAAGRVAVNGKALTSPAVNVLRSDKITVDNKILPQAERTRLWLYHKPAGLVTTNRDPEGRPTVFDALPAELPRVLSVGRLDINTEGLLLLTNDGGLSRILELPSTGWLRRYRVRAHGTVTQAQLDELKNGIAVDGVFYGSVEAVLEREQGANIWLSIGLREGKNREVKNILGALGLVVSRLIRVSFGPFQLGDLETGAVKEIRGRTLREQLGERLVEESGADFDAPLYNEFSNAAVKGDVPQRRGRADIYENSEADTGEDNHSLQKNERTRSDRTSSDWISGSRNTGSRDARGGFRSRGERDRREEGRARLSTSAPRAGEFGKSRFAKTGAGADAATTRPRAANVWMAPGAKPVTKGSAKPAAKDERCKSRQPRDGEGAVAVERNGYKRQGLRRDEEKRDGFKREGLRSENRRSYEADRPVREERRPQENRAYDKKPAGDKKPFGGRSSGDKPFRGRPSGSRGSNPRGSGPRTSGNRGNKR